MQYEQKFNTRYTYRRMGLSKAHEPKPKHHRTGYIVIGIIFLIYVLAGMPTLISECGINTLC